MSRIIFKLTNKLQIPSLWSCQKKELNLNETLANFLSETDKGYQFF